MGRMGKVRGILIYLCIAMMLTFSNVETQAAQKVNYENPDDIVVVLDVSGSMAATDEERLAFETIELLFKLGDSTDRIGVVAFNENIVYQSELTKIEDESAVTKILEEMKQIAYRGDTDNGLGLSTGLKMLKQEEQDNHNQAIIFISDGKIDLPSPIEGRTVEISKQDMEQSIAEAVQRKIPIYTFGFSTSEPEIVDELTAIAATTQASSHICRGPLQMMNNVIEIAMLYKNEYTVENSSRKPDESLQTYETELNDKNKSCIIFQTSGQLADFEVIAPEMTYEVTGTKHCQVVSFAEKQSGKITLCYRAEKECNAIISDIRFPIKEEIKPVEEVKVVAPKPEKPVEVPMPAPEPEKDNGIWVAMLGVIIVTICVCAGIVYAFFHKPKEKKPQPVLNGYLYACFIDLKSKNDIPATIWNLKDYPQEGVTLKELFNASGIQEDLPQLEKICLYPGEEGQGLLLVHCIDGGIFIDDKSVSRNVPAQVHYGETIYVAFPENASEFSLKYEEKKEEIERCM